MRLGGRVPALLTEWRFVAEDMHNISQRVQEFDSDARLAMEMETEHLGIVRRVVLPVNPDVLEANPHDTWIIGLRLRDPDTKQPIVGESDGRVLDLMRLYDSWAKRNPARFRASAEAAVAAREQQIEQAIRERSREAVEQYLFHGRRRYGIYKNIYVPADLPRAG